MVLWVRRDLPYRSLSELQGAKSTIAIGSTAKGTTLYIVPAVWATVLKLNFKLVPGYGGLAPIVNAVEQGEVDGAAGAFVSPPIQRGRKEGFLRPILYMASQNVPELDRAGVVKLGDLPLEPSVRQLLNLVRIPNLAAFTFAVPPGVSAERVAMLRAAFEATMKDPLLLREVKRAKLEMTPMSGEKVDRLQRSLFNTPENIIATFSTYAKAK